MSTNVPIASITISAATPSITFTDIPQTYTDLVLVMNAKTTSTSSGNNYFLVRFNSDSNSNYSRTGMYGDGSSSGSFRNTSQTSTYTTIGYNSSSFGNAILNFMNYSNSTTYKTILHRDNYPESATYAAVSLWRSTSAIISVTISGDGFNIASGSTFNLYGINAANSAQAKATGGDSIYRDASYWYHVFYKSGTFTPAQNLSNVDYLVVAGGGGGYVQGGGAGGMRCTVTATGRGGALESPISLNNGTAYTVTIGAGGSRGNSGTTGSNSSISGTGLTTISSTGGGGTSAGGANGMNGGSGGGAFNSGTPGSGTANQGYDGGTCPTGNAGAGGGGAGSAGGAGSGNAGGNGGSGVSTSISGTSVTYAGGGAGYGISSSGTAGTGGGGTAGAASPTSDGKANFGGGGGGNNAGNGGFGGSGIVIVRYTV